MAISYLTSNVLQVIKHYSEELDDSVRNTVRKRKIYLTKSKKNLTDTLNDFKSVGVGRYMYGEIVTAKMIREIEFELNYVNQKINELLGTK